MALMLKRRKINEKETREGSIFQVLNRKNKRNRPGFGLYLKQLVNKNYDYIGGHISGNKPVDR